jgi:hypothetical protein
MSTASVVSAGFGNGATVPSSRAAIFFVSSLTVCLASSQLLPVIANNRVSEFKYLLEGDVDYVSNTEKWTVL